MANCTSLAWLLLFCIHLEAQSVRSSKDQPHCLEDSIEVIDLRATGQSVKIKKDQTPANHSLGWTPANQSFGPTPPKQSFGPTPPNHSFLQGIGEAHDVLRRLTPILASPGPAPALTPRPASSVVTLDQGAEVTMFTQSRHITQSTGLDIALVVGGLFLAVVLAVVVGSLCQSGQNASYAEEVDDDSDDSVVAMGQGLDPVIWLNKSAQCPVVASTGQAPAVNLVSPPWSVLTLNNVFKDCGMGETWKQGKSTKLAEDLKSELSQGKSSFFSQSISEKTGLKCIIYVMQLALHYVPDNLVLQEFAHTGNKTSFVTDEHRLPKTKIKNNERVEECFKRCLTLKLGMSEAIAVKFANKAVLLRADEEPTTGSAAANIPEMTTIVRKLTVLVHLEDENVDDKLRKDLGIDRGSLQVDARGMEFRWEKVAEDYGLRRLLRKAPDARKVRPNWKSSGMAVLPWSTTDVEEELRSRGIAASSFGKDLPLLVQLLRTGEVQLGIEENTGKLVCVEHRVHLKVSKMNGDYLVHKGSDSTAPCLPCVRLLANETPFVAALRAARTKLGSVFLRVELQLRVLDMQSKVTPQPPEIFANGEPLKYVVRELLVEALARP